MAKTIQEQIADIEERCNKLETLQKLFDKMVKNEFGLNTKKIHTIIENNNPSNNDFVEKICSYFCLKTDHDLNKFLTIFCTESSLNYFNKRRFSENDGIDKMQG